MFRIQSIYRHDSICESEEIPSLKTEMFTWGGKVLRVRGVPHTDIPTPSFREGG